jgi:hypothetical protein
MRETRFRRLLVIVLCASGFVALWVVADRSLSTPDAANSAPSESSSRSGRQPASGEAPGAPGTDAGTTHPGGPVGHGRSTEPIGRTTTTDHLRSPATRGSTASAVLPAVDGLRVIDNNHDSITVRWNAVTNGGDPGSPRVAYYQATLNGIPSGETAGRQLTINWFNDEMTTHFIRVRAVDTAGHRGRPGDPLIVERPDEPTTPASPTATSRPSPEPSRSPSPASTPGPTSTTPTTNPAPPPGLVRPGPTPNPTADQPVTSAPTTPSSGPAAGSTTDATSDTGGG